MFVRSSNHIPSVCQVYLPVRELIHEIKIRKACVTNECPDYHNCRTTTYSWHLPHTWSEW
jgi:hypothetical protein